MPNSSDSKESQKIRGNASSPGSTCEQTQYIGLEKTWRYKFSNQKLVIVLLSLFSTLQSVNIDQNEGFIKNGQSPLTINSAGHAMHVFINGQLSGTVYGSLRLFVFAFTLARAFSHYLTIMGIAETHHRGWRGLWYEFQNLVMSIQPACEGDFGPALGAINTLCSKRVRYPPSRSNFSSEPVVTVQV
ncbi:unnamed protein product [Vicia faba]|uniref:Uncharacterized protein n=1 Tax=Vicia faba TaxID=3906 RepID=A0AAV1AJ01_VICFA|nr:unnamed protein product [Vicia faba]